MAEQLPPIEALWPEAFVGLRPYMKNVGKGELVKMIYIRMLYCIKSQGAMKTAEQLTAANDSYISIAKRVWAEYGTELSAELQGTAAVFEQSEKGTAYYCLLPSRKQADAVENKKTSAATVMRAGHKNSCRVRAIYPSAPPSAWV